jgi:hypothetical protein
MEVAIYGLFGMVLALYRQNKFRYRPDVSLYLAG